MIQCCLAILVSFPLLLSAKQVEVRAAVPGHDVGQVTAKYTYDEDKLTLRTFYTYDEQGLLISAKTDDGIHENPDSDEGVSHQCVVTYGDEPSGSTLFESLPSTDDIRERCEAFYAYLQQLRTHFISDETLASDRNLINYMEREVEKNLEIILGPVLFRLTGYHTRPEISGVFGNGEYNPLVRITFINGIGNTPADHEQNLTQFSRAHGGMNIHYIFRAFEGWSQDMFYCVVANFGIPSSQSRQLAALWKRLIADMGGTESGGTIIHYAHSVGGSETAIAHSLMTPEELKMIRVYTFGSPTLIETKNFQYAWNYVSNRDGVGAIDILRWINGILHPGSNITYLPSDEYYIIDHVLSNPAYSRVIEQLGHEFMETYLQQDKSIDL